MTTLATTGFVIRPAQSDGDVGTVRHLFGEYQAWLGVDLCFQGFAAELAALPGAYAPPRGRLLLAERRAEEEAAKGGPAANDVANRIAGCVALRPLDDDRCEMKRLFVRPEHHGLGLGRRLVTTLVAEARAIGYREMVLDTLPQMKEAQRLYESLGFRDIEPYCPNPIPGARYLALDLTAC
jgi:ribosomal protein S18 acetylase RimI-like enzyme